MIKKYTAIAMIAVSSLILTGCGDENEDKVIKIMQDEVKMHLDDPDSAKFSDLKVVKIDENRDDYIVCGIVDGKDKKGRDYHNEISSVVYYDSKQKKWSGFVEPRYSFYEGVLNKEFYIYKAACTDGVKAYEKKLHDSLNDNKE
ncbi:hypothetical protein N6B35_29705 (plasmid) [Klebsiella michiganensis]|uniref:hypothetical protein n=1 Tax=Klebsiella michiganensis TaxID=1134687 RepID=UPI0021D9DE47|nr:hypothetical protein [Klebsiella michiganensis]UYB60077.1 hypothetical protein N6B35_29705 [Klebsiella michiganensis]